MTPDYRRVHSDGWETTYVKDDPRLGIRTYLIFRHQTGEITVRKTQRVDRVLDLNKEQQSMGTNHKAPMRQVSRIPMVEWSKIMARCGLENGEYDRAKFNAILDDSDNKYLKTTTAKLGRPSVMV